MSGQNHKMSGSATKNSSSPSAHSRPYFTYKPNINVLPKGASEVKINIKAGQVGKIRKNMLDWSIEKEMQV